ncbi:queuosine precursor transporter [Paenisporosarcina quisquiliarum]|uniref:Probable queuosine precursor transporter n=1 Tax=Paenisporosarcina quisquiliarum TaxID=365346 RepID=A0A9X3RBQ4_9BACL|nr:queuosine precursor transporter [Paenisporosarcina quisquiliarum]MCZ8535845.1 queuosine precursor transporter [Paenisporosarcina quisquiliarum]
MFNEMLGLGFAIVNMLFVLILYKFFGRTGLFVWVGFATVLANIQVTKLIEIFGLTATLGNAIYGSIFLVTDILNEKYGKKEAKKAVWLGFISLLMMTVIMQMVLLFQPAADDFAQESLSTIFGLIPRIALGSMIAYLVSQYTDVLIFSFLRKLFPSDGAFWIRNNGSTMLSQLLDTLIFTSIAFWGVYPTDVWLSVFISTYVLKFLVSILGTPFGYIAKRMTPVDEK